MVVIWDHVGRLLWWIYGIMLAGFRGEGGCWQVSVRERGEDVGRVSWKRRKDVGRMIRGFRDVKDVKTKNNKTYIYQRHHTSDKQKQANKHKQTTIIKQVGKLTNKSPENMNKDLMNAQQT